jgi:hypothetical protein
LLAAKRPAIRYDPEYREAVEFVLARMPKPGAP